MWDIGKFWRELTMKPQGFTLVIAGYLPTLAVMAMFPVVATMIEHFRADPEAASKVPAMVTSPGYAIALIAPFAGLLADRFGRRRLLLISTLFYGIVGSAPFFMEQLDPIFVSRLALGIFEAGVLTLTNTLIADYWDNKGRRNWLMFMGLFGTLVQPVVFFMVSIGSTIRWNGGFLVYLIALPVFIAMYAFVFEPKMDQRRDEAIAVAPQVDERFPYAAGLSVAVVTLSVSLLFYMMIVFGSVMWGRVGVVGAMEVSKHTVVPILFVLGGTALFRFMSDYRTGFQFAVLLTIFGIGLGCIALATTPTELAIGFSIQQIAGGMTVPMLIAWAQSKFEFEHRGRGMGIWTCAFFLGQALSPIATNFVGGQTGGIHGAFLVAAGLSLVGALAGMIVSLRDRAAAAT